MEYKVISLPYGTSKKNREEIARILNEEAANGWTLDNVLQPQQIFGTTYSEHSAILKRKS
ncbi:DUF4177 domain-containing protein [Shouchella patagoniensis]|uniref:DUF4177 domain-containing protein n=1 Tax=Shouchella patagoniensis TaxID=228576 RepID=UPI0009953780|nr:DUF4177 domain-containing protein [Shouchella patagoniensis]